MAVTEPAFQAAEVGVEAVVQDDDVRVAAAAASAGAAVLQQQIEPGRSPGPLLLLLGRQLRQRQIARRPDADLDRAGNWVLILLVVL